MLKKAAIGLIITAAGQSVRFGGNKLWETLDGKPVIQYTIETCAAAYSFSEIVVTTSQENHDALTAMMTDLRIQPIPKIVMGGATRQASVQNGFRTLEASDYVLIHDGARPNPSQDLILRLIATVIQTGAAIPVIDMEDTVKHVSNKTVLNTVDRHTLKRAQTPQAFRYDILEKAYTQIQQTQPHNTTTPLNETKPTFTDESSLVEPIHPVSIIKGDPKNIKITHPEDFLIWKCYTR